MRYLIVVPTYNEADNLERLTNTLLSDPAAHLLILDDHSPDGTGQIADRLAAREDRVSVIHRPRKMGQGSAYVVGFEFALGRDFSHVVQMDCDFSHDPLDVPRLLVALEGGADVAIGSRYTRGGEVEGWGITRRLLSWFANTYTKCALGFEIKDWTSGFKAFTRESLGILMAHSDYLEGYGFHVEETFRARAAGLVVREVPITFTDRVLGRSKMGKQIMWEASWRVLRLAAERWLHKKTPPIVTTTSETRSAEADVRRASTGRN